MENEKQIEYVLVQTPDIIKLGEYVIRAKGPNRTMAQFADECGVGASTLSRIANGKIRKPLTEDVIRAIYEHSDPESGVSLDTFMLLNGFRDKTAYERRNSYAHDFSSRDEAMNRERKMKNTIMAALVDRNVPVVRLREVIGKVSNEVSYDMPIRFDFAFEINEEQEKEWYFRTFVHQSDERRPLPIYMDRITMLATRIFLQDAWNPVKFDNKKISFVFCDERIFERFVQSYKGAPIQSAMSAILIDTEKEKIVDEVWISCKPESPSVLSRPIELENEDAEMGELIFRPEDYIEFQNDYWRKPNE